MVPPRPCGLLIVQFTLQISVGRLAVFLINRYLYYIISDGGVNGIYVVCRSGLLMILIIISVVLDELFYTAHHQ